MGGFGASPGAIAQYDPVHRDFHSWMLTGTDHADLYTGTDLKYERGQDGVMSVIEQLFSTHEVGNVQIGTPFDDLEVYDPFQEGEPLYELMDKLRIINEEMFGEEGDFVGSDKWPEHFDMVKAKLEDFTDEIDSLVAAFETKMESQVEGKKSEINSAFSQGISSSNRTIAHALMLRDVSRQVAEYRAQLEHQYAIRKMEINADVPTKLVAYDNDFRDRRTQYMVSFLGATEMMYNAKKLMTQEELQYAIESTLWDVNLYSFAGQALSAISGATIVPRSPNPKLEALSTAAVVSGAVINLGRAAADLGAFK